MICTALRWCYLNSVQTDNPAPPGVALKNADGETHMTIRMIETQVDRYATTLLLALGLLASVAFATAGLA